MNDIILLKQGEIVLKGLNKKAFEQKLMANVQRRLRPYASTRSSPRSTWSRRTTMPTWTGPSRR